jgi:hypothetical protein
MKRYSSLLIFSTLLMLLGASASFAVFPVPDGSVVLPLHQGWFNYAPAWFISTDTSDINMAGQQKLTLFMGVPTGAPPVYIVTNLINGQGPVFSAAPDPVPSPRTQPPYYSGLWQVVYATWSTGAVKVTLTSELQIMDMVSRGAITLLGTPISVDYSIMALGPLGRPDYLIPQAQDLRLATREVRLPTWNIVSQDPMNGKVSVKRVIIPDALSLGGYVPGNIDLSVLLGANQAYGLGSIGPVDINNTIAAIDWTQLVDNRSFLRVPANQLLVGREAPTACSTANLNSAYSPFANLVVMVRFPLLPPGYVFSTWGQIANSPGLSGVFGDTVNAPVLCY